MIPQTLFVQVFFSFTFCVYFVIFLSKGTFFTPVPHKFSRYLCVSLFVCVFFSLDGFVSVWLYEWSTFLWFVFRTLFYGQFVLFLYLEEVLFLSYSEFGVARAYRVGGGYLFISKFESVQFSIYFWETGTITITIESVATEILGYIWSLLWVFFPTYLTFSICTLVYRPYF